jgi:hypothetical protein
MKTGLILFFLLSLGIGHSQGSGDTLVISGQVKYKRIPTCIGENCASAQCYAPGVQPGPAAAYILNQDAQIGKIKHSMMLCETPDGVCNKMIITLRDAESVKQAGKQASKQFGNPVYTKEGGSYVYTWMYATPEKHQLKITLKIAADLYTGVLFVEQQI